MSKLPPFATLAPNYPTDHDADRVKGSIGGEVDADWITNTCVVRVSKAFNYAGKPYEIPRKRSGLLTIKGSDQKYYAIRVQEFITRSGSKISVDPFRGHTGIIAWQVRGWSDATGHFTLWDGEKGLYEGEHHYFELPTTKPDEGGPWVTKVELWYC